MENKTSSAVGRRMIIRAGLLTGGIGAWSLSAPAIIAARGETPIKFGMIDPLTGSYSALGQAELEGAKLGVDEINASGGLLGRQVQLLAEDSASDVGIGVQKAHKLFDRENVDVLFGNVNSAISLALTQVSSQYGKLHVVNGGATDSITGSDCHWNVFRICNTTVMDANAISRILMEKLGKKWFFVTPDYAYGHSLQSSFLKNLTAASGTYDSVLVPIGTTDFSAYLIKAKSYGPDVLINLLGGNDQVNSLKQFVQFGLQKQMAIGGSLFEMEGLQGLPPDAHTGWWVMPWYWNQPNVPHVQEFVAAIRKATGKVPTARHWYGYVGSHSIRLAAERAKSLDGRQLAKTMENMVLPPEVALQVNPEKAMYRAGDHQLMSSILVGQARNPPPGGDKADLFEIAQIVPGESVALPVDQTGCRITYPA